MSDQQAPASGVVDVLLDGAYAQLQSLVIGDRVKTTSRPPQAFLVVGPPGSGKRRLAAMALNACTDQGSDPIHIDSDLYRAHVPGYDTLAESDQDAAFALSQPVVSLWADELRDGAISRQLDLVIEGLFKTHANTTRLCHLLLAQQYRRSVMMKLVPRAISLLQVELRYERQLAAQTLTGGSIHWESVPRRLSAAAHASVYETTRLFLAHVETNRLVECITVHDAVNREIYTSPIFGPDGSASRFLEQAMLSPMDSSMQSVAYRIMEEISLLRVQRGRDIAPEPGSALEAAVDLLFKEGSLLESVRDHFVF